MKDLVCGMDVDLPAKHLSFWEGKEYAFCSTGCNSKFDSEPGKYIGKNVISGTALFFNRSQFKLHRQNEHGTWS